MSEDPAQITTLSDISANMFAAFILILIMVAAAAASRQPIEGPPKAAITDRDLHFVERAALDSKAMVDMLYDRRPGAPGASVDLFASRVTISLGGGSQPALASALPSLIGGRSAPVRLYVFANDQYEAVARTLAQAGLAWREISVPRALRSREGDDWASPFKELAREAVDPAQFRAGLARLLDAGEGRSPAARAPVGGSAEEAGALNVIARFDRALRVALNVLAVVVACGVVFLIERRTRGARHREHSEKQI